MRRGETIKKIFLTIERILEDGEIIFSRQNLWSKLNRISKNQDGGRREFNQVIRRSVKHNWIEIQERNGKIFYRLTPIGLKKISFYKFNEIKINRGEWDGFWRVIVFDVPETERHGRDALRKILQHFGFYSLQKSVFIYPFKCEKEIKNLCDFWGISSCVEIFLTRSVGKKEEQLKTFFNI